MDSMKKLSSGMSALFILILVLVSSQRPHAIYGGSVKIGAPKSLCSIRFQKDDDLLGTCTGTLTG